MEDPQVLYPQQLIIGNKLRITLDDSNVVHVQQPVPGKSDVILSAGDWQDIGTMDVLNAIFSAIGSFSVGGTLSIGESLSVGVSTTADVVASAGTVSTAGVGVARVAPGAAVTGVILEAGTVDGQPVVVLNESAAADSVTFAAAATSNVADGVSAVVAGLAQKTFYWDTSTSLWYHD